jgi:hypothetical protein
MRTALIFSAFFMASVLAGILAIVNHYPTSKGTGLDFLPSEAEKERYSHLWGFSARAADCNAIDLDLDSRLSDEVLSGQIEQALSPVFFSKTPKLKDAPPCWITKGVYLSVLHKTESGGFTAEWACVAGAPSIFLIRHRDGTRFIQDNAMDVKDPARSKTLRMSKDGLREADGFIVWRFRSTEGQFLKLSPASQSST